MSTISISTPHSFSTEGATLLCSFEGFSKCPYLDSVGVATIGFGSTYYENGVHVTMADSCITKERATILMLHIWNRDFLPTLLSSVTVPLTQHQLDALGCLVYNIGSGAFKSSTVLKRINSHDTRENITAAWGMWNRGGGKVLRGLTNRRAAEVAYFYS